jgi:deoxycytidine triphosphate deaminase
MLQNADQVLELLTTHAKGAKAQVGYDLTLKEVKHVRGGHVMSDRTTITDYVQINPITFAEGRREFRLIPGTYSLTFEQGIKLPTNKTAFIRHRSSILRCGSVITSGIFDPGFEVDQMGAVLIVTEPITIEEGARVAQVYVFENSEADAYSGQWQGTKDVK